MKMKKTILFLVLATIVASITVAQGYNYYYTPTYSENVVITLYEGVTKSTGQKYKEVIKFEVWECDNSCYNFSKASIVACAGIDYLYATGASPWLLGCYNEIDFRDFILSTARQWPRGSRIAVSAQEEQFNSSREEKGDLFFYPEFATSSENIKIKEYGETGEKIVRIEVVDPDYSDSFSVSFMYVNETLIITPIYVPGADSVANDLFVYDAIYGNIGLISMSYSPIRQEIERQMEQESYIVLFSTSDFENTISPLIWKGDGYIITEESDGGDLRFYITNAELISAEINPAIDTIAELRGDSFSEEEKEALRREIEYRISVINEDNRMLLAEESSKADRQFARSELLFYSLIEFD